MDIMKEKVFGKTSLADILEEVHTRSRMKERQIDDIVREIKNRVKTIKDIEIIHDIIKDYMDVSVKNDESLLKIATIYQRIAVAHLKEGEGELLPENEIQQLLDDSTKLAEEAIERLNSSEED